MRLSPAGQGQGLRGGGGSACTEGPEYWRGARQELAERDGTAISETVGPLKSVDRGGRDSVQGALWTDDYQHRQTVGWDWGARGESSQHTASVWEGDTDLPTISTGTTFNRKSSLFPRLLDGNGLQCIQNSQAHTAGGMLPPRFLTGLLLFPSSADWPPGL